MNVAIALIVGVILGFGIEWAFDFFFLRNKSRKLESELKQVRSENDELQAQVTFLETGELPIADTVVDETLEEPTGESGFIYEEEQSLVEDNEPADKDLPTVVLDSEIVDEVSEESEWTPLDNKSSEISISEVASAGITAAVLLGDEEELEEGVMDMDENIIDDAEIQEEISQETQKPDSLDDDPEWVLEDTEGDGSGEQEAPMMAGAKSEQNIEFIEGIGTTYGSRLREIGIVNPQALLERGATRKGRSEIAEQTAIPESLILKWVNQVDLFRIKGIGSEYAEILEVAGVDTVLELAQRNPENLYNKLNQINSEHQRVRQLPGINQVEDWIKQANELPRILSY